MLDLQCSGSDAPIVTPYRSPTHHRRRKSTDRDARLPARAGSFLGGEPTIARSASDDPLAPQADPPITAFGLPHSTQPRRWSAYRPTTAFHPKSDLPTVDALQCGGGFVQAIVAAPLSSPAGHSVASPAARGRPARSRHSGGSWRPDHDSGNALSRSTIRHAAEFFHNVLQLA